MSTKDSDMTLSKILEFLKQELNPSRLFFYGSRAAGTARADSDYDFVVVVPNFDSKKRAEMMSQISTQLWKQLGVEVQVWIYSQTDFENSKDDFSSIPETAVNTGTEVNLG